MASGIDQSIIDTAKEYVQVLRKNNVSFESVWLFGSSVRGQINEESDIDIAIVMKEVSERFFKELELLKYRRKIDSRLEPHILTTEELNSPFNYEIKETGMKIA